MRKDTSDSIWWKRHEAKFLTKIRQHVMQQWTSIRYYRSSSSNFIRPNWISAFNTDVGSIQFTFSMEKNTDTHAHIHTQLDLTSLSVLLGFQWNTWQIASPEQFILNQSNQWVQNSQGNLLTTQFSLPSSSSSQSNLQIDLNARTILNKLQHNEAITSALLDSINFGILMLIFKNSKYPI